MGNGMTISLDQILTWIQRAVQVVLILIFAVTLASKLGFRVPMIPTASAIELLYLCGAYALLTGRFKLG